MYENSKKKRSVLLRTVFSNYVGNAFVWFRDLGNDVCEKTSDSMVYEDEQWYVFCWMVK